MKHPNQAVEELVLRGVGLSYGNGRAPLLVFQGISFTVLPGELVCVVGPSGCGKTSLLKLIGGLLRPTQGEILLGRKTAEELRKLRCFSYVFQNPVLLPWRDLRQNVALPGIVYGDSDVTARSQAMIELVGLKGFERCHPEQLSGGMQSRAAIARALTCQPQFLLADEPFGSLDELNRAKLQMEFQRIWTAIGASVIFVTHSLSEAALLADRVLVMGERPAGIVADIPNSLPRPRSIETAETREYARVLHDIRAELNRER